MTKFIKLFPIVLLAFLASKNINAQNLRKSKKTVIVKKKNGRVISKTVVHKKPKKKVASVRTLPKKTIIKHKGVNYFYKNHRFYRYSGGKYIVISPKIGFRIKFLPTGYKTIEYLNRKYYWSNGIYYTYINNEYEVVKPEIGTIVYGIPNDYERMEINNYTYYEFSNILYEKIQINGTRAYEVVGFTE